MSLVVASDEARKLRKSELRAMDLQNDADLQESGRTEILCKCMDRALRGSVNSQKTMLAQPVYTLFC